MERREVDTSDSLSDENLIERAARGDIDAYDALVRRYQRDALRAAAAIAGPTMAEDVAQEAFVRAFRFLRPFRAGAPFRPWLLAIVANVARNHRRTAARWTRATERGAQIALDTAPSLEDVAVAADRRHDLWAAIETLPPRYRDVVACRYWLDLSEQETAHVLRIARGTVKSRLSRALDRLEQLLPSGVFDE